MTTLTISLPESLREFVDRQVAARDDGDVSEYFRDLLLEVQQADERLEALLLEGLESGGEDIVVDEKFWDDLKTETSQRIATHKKTA